MHLRGTGGFLRYPARLHRLGLVRAYDVLWHRQLCGRDSAVFARTELVVDRRRARDRLAAGGAARFGHRPVLAAGTGDLLLDDHARGRLRISGAGFATIVADGGRRRTQLLRSATAAAPHPTD